MELKRAKEVLEGMSIDFDAARMKSEYSINVHAIRGSSVAKIQGYLTPDQLEAIATWMRDPEGVVKA